ncbi:hypothetical protein FOMPIDRAFT_1116792, partial [Fomitopsis schrenkii]
ERCSTLFAALAASRLTPPDVPLTLVCATDFLAKALSDKLRIWEDRGWTHVHVAPVMRALVATLRQRCARTVLGTASSWNALRSVRRAESLASSPGAPACRPEDISLARNPAFDLTGARLTRLTQGLAYQGILARLPPLARPTTDRSVQRVLDSLESSGVTATRGMVWRSLRHNDLCRPVASFLWKVMHRAVRCGGFWLNIPGLEGRATCSICGQLDTVDHILTSCPAAECRVVWYCVAYLWQRKGLPWSSPTVEDILGAGCRRWPPPQGTAVARRGAPRLWRILISESAFLIWKLRCERVVAHADETGWVHHPRSVAARWAAAIVRRLQADRTLTLRRFGRMSMPAHRVFYTWTGVVADEAALPPDWASSPRVLVGILPIPMDDFG